MNKNQTLDNWLTKTGRTVFTHGDVVRELGVDAKTATKAIQAHVVAQNAIKTKMVNVIHRKGQARKAAWYVGHSEWEWASAREQHAVDISTRTRNGIEKLGGAMVIQNRKLRRPVHVTLAHIDAVLASL